MTHSSDQPDNAKPDKHRRRKWFWAWRVGLAVVLLPVVMAGAAAVMLIGREVSAPSWVVREVEARAAEVLAGGHVDFGEVSVTISQDLHPTLVVRNAVLRDAEGAVLAQVPRIRGLISPRGLVQGRVLPQDIRLQGAEISLRRAHDGTMALAFDQSGEALSVADDFIGLLDQIDNLFERGALEALEQVRATGLIINYVDLRAGRSWVVDDGRISLDLRGDALELGANVALLSGRNYVTTAELTYRSPKGSREAELGLAVSDAAAADIASQVPHLLWLGVLDAPISGALRGQLDTEAELRAVSATLQIGQGELRPNSQTRPIPFEGARTYLTYDPASHEMNFDVIEVDSDWGRISAAGKTYIRDFTDGWPSTMLGQLEFGAMSLRPENLFENPVVFEEADLDFRLRLDPFTLDIGQAALVHNGQILLGEGQVRAALEGWAIALDARAETIESDQALALWPQSLAPRTRAWVTQNIRGGLFHALRFGLRSRPGEAMHSALSVEFDGSEIQFLPSLPPIVEARGLLSLAERRFAIRLEGGHVTAPEGGQLDLTGSTMIVPQIGPGNPPGIFDLALRGRATAALAILNLEPFNAFRNSNLPVNFMAGDAQIDVHLETPLGPGVAPEQREWAALARLENVRSDILVPDRVVTARRLNLRADPASLTVQGRAALDGAEADITFARALGPGSEGTARLEADLALNPANLRRFNIRFPEGMVSGETPARLAVNLSNPAAPSFTLTSRLQGAVLRLAGLGWRKSAGQTGDLRVEGRLGPDPQINRVSISAPGLEAEGSITLARGGVFERANLASVRLGGWFDGPVTLIGRGQGQPAGIELRGGSLDLRAANFERQAGGEGRTGPIEVALDRLRITDSIYISDFRATFSNAGGLQGTFTGRLNESANIAGELVPMRGASAVRIRSDDAGGVFRAAGLLRNAHAGTMELSLVPTGQEGTYDGVLTGMNLRVRDAPALASLLDAISVVGLLTQLDGQGLLFTNVDAQFRLTPSQIIVTQSSAVGPGLGISLDGTYSQAAREMDFQGVISPFYLINGIGAIFTRPGEGLIGFNFNLRGPVDSPRVIVNPLSALTPGMFREIFRRPPPSIGQ